LLVFPILLGKRKETGAKTERKASREIGLEGKEKQNKCRELRKKERGKEGQGENG
jgi:hypothetical protein